MAVDDQQRKVVTCKYIVGYFESMRNITTPTWACPVFYLHFLEEILLKRSWKTGKVLRWLDKLNFNRPSRRNIFSWFAVFFYKISAIKEVCIFRYMFGRVTRYEYFSTANYRFVLQLFKPHLSSEDTYRPSIELSEPPSKLSQSQLPS